MRLSHDSRRQIRPRISCTVDSRTRSRRAIQLLPISVANFRRAFFAKNSSLSLRSSAQSRTVGCVDEGEKRTPRGFVRPYPQRASVSSDRRFVLPLCAFAEVRNSENSCDLPEGRLFGLLSYLKATRERRAINASSSASDPAQLELSDSKLRQLCPSLYLSSGVGGFVRCFFFDGLGKREFIRDMLSQGDSRAAVVMKSRPLLVACYCDDSDAVCMLRHRDDDPGREGEDRAGEPDVHVSVDHRADPAVTRKRDGEARRRPSAPSIRPVRYVNVL